MRIIPASGRDWVGLFLVPFKVFVPGGYLMAVIEREVLGSRRDTGEIIPFVLCGYIVTFLALVLGARIQRGLGARRAYLWTYGFTAGIFVFGFLLFPYLAHT